MYLHTDTVTCVFLYLFFHKIVQKVIISDEASSGKSPNGFYPQWLTWGLLKTTLVNYASEMQKKGF